MLYKVLTAEGLPAHGGTGEYPLPTKGKKGAWTVPVTPAACRRGYHLTTVPEQWWVPGARLFRAEYRGGFDISLPDKVAYESVRLVEEVTLTHPLISLFPCWAARMGKKDLSDVYLSRANLSGANLFRADLSRANLYCANLFCANLSGANLSSANLSGANLYCANLSGANLSRADLSGANLSGADLSGANLSGANLSGANLSRANPSRAIGYIP